MSVSRAELELMAPAGSRESLAAALRAGAGAVYFGIGSLNMRAHSAAAFTTADLRDIATLCRRRGVRTYLTVNTVVYDGDMAEMREIIDAAREAGITAVIAADVAVMQYCREKGVEVHLSTQLNIANTEALRFWAQWADVAVLARELSIEQVAEISRAIREEHICGPSGKPVRLEMFCHGALCMAVSGKCYLSLHEAAKSGNRGECVQICRRAYRLTDEETGREITVDNKYLLSPKDLKTVRFIDRLIKAGVTVFKIEGRARGAEYVDTVTRVYDEALTAACAGTTTEEMKDAWDCRLATVFNRGFWDGYYQGQRLGEWNERPGSRATERKQYCARVVGFFSRLSVMEVKVEACTVSVGDELLITGPTTGTLRCRCTEIRLDLRPVDLGPQQTNVSIPVPRKVRAGDKMFIIHREDESDGATLSDGASTVEQGR